MFDVRDDTEAVTAGELGGVDYRGGVKLVEEGGSAVNLLRVHFKVKGFDAIFVRCIRVVLHEGNRAEPDRHINAVFFFEVGLQVVRASMLLVECKAQPATAVRGHWRVRLKKSWVHRLRPSLNE